MLVTKREALPSLLTCSVLFSSNKNLLPVCCRVAGLVYTAALFALSSPCFWKVLSCSQPRLLDTHMRSYTHIMHTHTVMWRRTLSPDDYLSLADSASHSFFLSASLHLQLSCSSPALPFLIPIWVCVPGLKGLIIRLYALFFCSVHFGRGGGYF